MDETVTVSRADLEKMLIQWDADAESGKWPDRDDADRYRDNADYIFGLLNGGE